MRLHSRLVILVTAAALAILTFLRLRDSCANAPAHEAPKAPFEQSLPTDFGNLLSPTTEQSHPIARLINDANEAFEHKRARQSATLAEAVEEYRRRYGMPPPPNFDKWFRFAQQKGVQLID